MIALNMSPMELDCDVDGATLVFMYVCLIVTCLS